MFLIEIPFFDLEQIYQSGQVPRWIRSEEYKYVIPLGDKAFSITQKKEKVILSCDEERFFSELYQYFDINTPYDIHNWKYKRLNKSTKIACNRAKGMRILKQPLNEIIVQYLLADNLNADDARILINDLCQTFGKKHKQGLRELGAATWYEFPTHEQILKNRDWLSNDLLNGRKKKLLRYCKKVLSGEFSEDELTSLEYPESRDYLIKKLGLSDEQADKICLFGLHQMEVFPEDDIVIEALWDLGIGDRQELFDWYLEEDDKSAGVLYIYLRYNKENPPRRIEQWMKQ